MDSPLAKAETAARQHGYRFTWPPAPAPRVDTPDDLRAVLARLAAGELSAHLVTAAGRHLMEFFAAVPPETFQQVAQQLVHIVLWEETAAERPGRWREKPAARVRIRAVQAVLKPMLQVIGLLPKLERLRGDPSPVLAALLTSVYAFLGPLGGGRMGQIAAKLMEMAADSSSPDNAVRAAAAAADLTLAAMTTVINTRLGLEKAGGAPVDEAQLAQARAEFQSMLAQAEQKLARPPAASPAPQTRLCGKEPSNARLVSAAG